MKWWFAYIAAIAATPLLAQEPVLEAYVDGQIVSRDIRVDLASRSAETGVLWSDEISVAGSDYIRLLLRVEGPAFPPDARLVLAGALDQQVEIALDGIGDAGLWSKLMPFGRARMALITDSPVPDDTVLIIDSIAMQSGKIVPYSTVGANDLMPINGPDVPAHLRALGAPVAFLSFVQGGFARTCSGLLITPDKLLTNEHCINDTETCRTLTAVFGFEFDDRAQLRIGRQVGCRNVETLNAALDMSVITLDAPPGPEYGVVDIIGKDTDTGTPLVIVQHPGSQPKQISILDCAADQLRVDGRAPETDFTHTCDTASGSSGAPVFALDGTFVGLHHFGFQDGDIWDTNRAVHADLIADWLADNITPDEDPAE